MLFRVTTVTAVVVAADMVVGEAEATVAAEEAATVAEEEVATAVAEASKTK